VTFLKIITLVNEIGMAFTNRKDAIAWSKDTYSRLSRFEEKEWVCLVVGLGSVNYIAF
jgi:hypothetical protein